MTGAELKGSSKSDQNPGKWLIWSLFQVSFDKGRVSRAKKLKTNLKWQCISYFCYKFSRGCLWLRDIGFVFCSIIKIFEYKYVIFHQYTFTFTWPLLPGTWSNTDVWFYSWCKLVWPGEYSSVINNGSNQQWSQWSPHIQVYSPEGQMLLHLPQGQPVGVIDSYTCHCFLMSGRSQALFIWVFTSLSTLYRLYHEVVLFQRKPVHTVGECSVL